MYCESEEELVTVITAHGSFRHPQATSYFEDGSDFVVIEDGTNYCYPLAVLVRVSFPAETDWSC